MPSLNNDKKLYQPWNEEEFISDFHVQNMTPVQRWMYRSLLAQMFFCPWKPYLPDDDDMLWRLAGCESKDQWLKNREDIMVKFFPAEVDGLSLLGNKRVLIDWNRESNRKEILSEQGRKGGLARAASNSSSSQARAELEPGLNEASNEAKLDLGLSEVQAQNRTEQTEQTRPTEPTYGKLRKQPNVLKIIPQRCREILHIRSEPVEWRKDDLLELAEAHGGDRVVEAFEEWAKSKEGEVVTKPLLAFIQVADGFLAGTFSAADTAQVDALCSRLYAIGNKEFSGKNRSVIGRMMKEFSAKEIEGAYKEFIADRDAFDMKTAAKSFCEGGGRDVINNQRSLRAKAEAQDSFLTEQAAIQAREAQAEIDAQLDAERAEQSQEEIL